MAIDRGTEYEIALSFAGEDRAYVEMVAEQLRARGISLFYDRYEQADLWGKDLYEHLTDVYRAKAQYTLMFISKYYKEKVWTNHERRAAQSRAIEESREYILPARFDDTDIPGILPTTGYIDLRNQSPAEVAILIAEKLGRNPHSVKAYQVPSPKNPSLEGEATFNYSSNNGQFRIGDGTLEFETKWSKAGPDSIWCYADSSSVRGIALVDAGTQLNTIRSVSHLDFTSRARGVNRNSCVILQNHHGIYAAVRILDIRADGLGESGDLLRFRYWILRDGSGDFSSITEP